MHRSTFALVLAPMIALACGGSGPAAQPPPAAGACSGESRPQLDCASEVKYDAASAEGGFSVLGVGGASAKFEQKALRDIDRETALFIAEARRLCDEYNKCVLDKETYATRSENLRRRMAKVPELREEVKNAKSDDDRRAALAKAYRAIVPDEARSDFTLDFSVLAQKPGESTMAPIEAKTALGTGAHVAFVVNVSRPAYVYLFQKSPNGSIAVLFPDARIPVSNPLTAKAPLRIPQGTRSFVLDDKDIGTESVYIVASLTPITELASVADRSSPGASKVTAIDADCKTRGLALEPDAPAPAGECVRPRGLSLDDDGGGGAPKEARRASVRATTEAGDSVIATVFRFEHTR